MSGNTTRDWRSGALRLVTTDATIVGDGVECSSLPPFQTFLEDTTVDAARKPWFGASKHEAIEGRLQYDRAKGATTHAITGPPGVAKSWTRCNEHYCTMVFFPKHDRAAMFVRGDDPIFGWMATDGNARAQRERPVVAHGVARPERSPARRSLVFRQAGGCSCIVRRLHPRRTCYGRELKAYLGAPPFDAERWQILPRMAPYVRHERNNLVAERKRVGNLLGAYGI